MGLKVAVVVGHNAQAPGAYAREPIGRTEFEFNCAVAVAMERLSVPGGVVMSRFLRTALGGYTQEIRRVYGYVDAWGADASIELHFNADGPTATGTETLHSGSPGSLRLATCLQAAMLAALKLRDRGLVERREGRGALSLVAGRAPAVIVEPFFGSSTLDCMSVAAAGGAEGLAIAYLRGLSAWASGR